MAGLPFDATLKDLIESDPAAWSALGSDRPARRVTVEDGDVSSVSAAADKVLRVEDDAGVWLHDVEPESGHAAEAPDKLFLYSTLLAHRHGLPVCSTLLLLRPEANASAATGELKRCLPGEAEPYLSFRYRVVRVWEEPQERFLDGPLGTLPLAVLTNEAKADLVGTVKRIDERLRSLSNPVMAGRMQACTLILLGLRYTKERIAELRKGIAMVDLRESSFYTLIRDEVREEVRDKVRDEVREEVRDKVRDEVREEVRDKVRDEVREEVRDEVREEVRDKVRDEVREEVRDKVRDEVREEVRVEIVAEVEKKGQLAASRRMILSMGRRKFGVPKPDVETTLEGITDQAKLESIADRLLDVSTWEDLLAGA